MTGTAATGRPGPGDVHPPLQHREARAVAVEHGDLPVQDHRAPPGRQRKRRGDLRVAAGHVPSAPPPQHDRSAADVAEDPGPVPLGLGRPLALVRGYRSGRGGEHGLDQRQAPGHRGHDPPARQGRVRPGRPRQRKGGQHPGSYPPAPTLTQIVGRVARRGRPLSRRPDRSAVAYWVAPGEWRCDGSFPPRSSCRQLIRAPPIEEALVSDVNIKAAISGDATRFLMFPKIELHVHLEGSVRARTLLQIARRNDVAAASGHGRGAGRALSVPRLHALHRGVAAHHPGAAHRAGLPPGGDRLRGRGGRPRRGLPRGDLHPGRAGRARLRLG